MVMDSEDFGIVGHPLFEFSFRQGMQTSRQRRHADVIDRLNNPILKNNLSLGHLGKGKYTKQQRKGHGEDVAEFAQRAFS